MIGTGWFAAISTTITSKWVLFILGCIFFYPILDAVLGFTPDPKNRESNAGHNRFVILYTAVVWNGYVILWILHDGFGWVSLDTECVIHTVLDILAKDLFGVVLLYNHIDDTQSPNDNSYNSSITSSPPPSPRMHEMVERRIDHIDTGSIRRSNTGPPNRLNHDRTNIRRSSTGPARSPREPQIVITPPVTREHTPGQRRPSVSSDRPLTLSSEDSDGGIELRVHSRSPSPQPRRSRAQSPRPYRDAEYDDDTDEIQRPSRPRSPRPSREYHSSLKAQEDTPDYEDKISVTNQVASSPARQNVLNRAIQTFDRIRQMI